MGGVHRRHDRKFESFGIVLFQVQANFLDQFGIMRSFFIQPKNSRYAGFSCTLHGQADPIPDGGVFGLTCP